MDLLNSKMITKTLKFWSPSNIVRFFIQGSFEQTNSVLHQNSLNFLKTFLALSNLLWFTFICEYSYTLNIIGLKIEYIGFTMTCRRHIIWKWCPPWKIARWTRFFITILWSQNKLTAFGTFRRIIFITSQTANEMTTWK